jgi:outer membrane beta-barrel protein
MRQARGGQFALRLQRHTLALLALLGPGIGLGQATEQPGIDLSQPERPAARPAEQAPAPGTEGKPAARPREEAPLAPGEHDAAFQDRVKAVQLKGFLKRHRFELGLSLPGTVNDAFYQKVGIGAKLAYNFEDSFALAVRGTYFWQLRSSHVREGNVAFQSQLLASQLYGQAMLDGVWSPIYGKVAWLGSRIVHFDAYLLAGLGAVWSATSAAPRSEGPHVATDLGLGLRFYPADWLALDGGLIATFYPDQPNTGVPGTIQRQVAAHVGVTFFLPLGFEYGSP